MCTKNMDADIKEDFKIYLNFIDLNNISVFSAISQLDNNKYLWVNIWPSKLERLNSLDKLIKKPKCSINIWFIKKIWYLRFS